MPQFRSLACLLAGFAVLASLACAEQQQPARPAPPSFTIEQVLSAPYNSDLVAAPVGVAFAWVANAQGRRNLWVAEPASAASGRREHASAANASGLISWQLTHDDQDDGQSVESLGWSPDARSIVYVRGGDPGGQWNRSPNPALLPQGAEQNIWLVSLGGGASRKLGQGNSPAFSPRGDAIAWILNGQIWYENLAAPHPQPAPLLVTLGQSEALTWSPDGSQLAFVSDRGSHSFIGVYTFASHTLRYLDPGTGHDLYPEWSPNGREVAFIRIPYAKDEDEDRLERVGQPWSILMADAQTGVGRVVWTAQRGPGSVFDSLEGNQQLFWMANGELVFPWERDGWNHLYSLDVRSGADSKSARLLTPGDYIVEDIAMSPDRRRIVYSSNENDRERRHIWRLTMSGAPVALTHGDGIETAPVIASDNRTVAVLRSDARIPIRPALVGAKGRLEDLAPQMIPASFPAASMVAPLPVRFHATDGLSIDGQLFLPDGVEDCVRRPAIVFVHGGPQRQMLLGWHPMRYYSNAYGMNEYLASRGYVVLSINYRSGIGYGLDFREALDYGPMGDSELRDVVGAALYLKSRCDVEAKHIGIWGGSWGGFLTALALARDSNLFAAGVDLSGVHDWNIDHPQNFAISDSVANPNALWQLAWKSSPLAYVDTWRSPVLLIQGDDDREVPFLQTVQLAAALSAHHVPYQELIFPDEVHSFLLHRDWIAAYTAAAQFFKEYLKPTANP